MLGAMKNCGRWSEIDKVRLPDTIFWDIALSNMMYIRDLKLLLILVGKSIWGKNEWEVGNQEIHLFRCFDLNLEDLY